MEPCLNVSVEKWTGADIHWDYETQEWILTGPMREVLNILSKNHFNSKLVRASDQQWGMYFQNNNSWTGMVGLLQKNQTDLALGPLALTYQRSLVSPFTRPLFSDGITILSAYSDNQKIDIFEPVIILLQDKIWFLIVIALIVLSITTALSTQFRSAENLTKKRFFIVLPKSLWILLSIFYLRGNGLSRMTLFSIDRKVVFLTSITALFITTMLSALIGTSIIIGSEITNIDSLEKLLTKDHIIPVVIKGSFEMQLFEKNNVELYKKVWQKIKDNLVSSEELHSSEMMSDVINGKKAIIGSVVSLYGLATNMCLSNTNARLYLGKQLFSPTQFVLMISHQTNINYPKLFKYVDDVTFYLSSNGIFNRLILKTFNYTIKCIVDSNPKLSPDNFDVFSFYLSHTSTIFQIYFIIVLIALIVLICEVIAFETLKRLYLRYKNEKQKSQNLVKLN